MRDERLFEDLTTIMRALIKIGWNVEVCRQILEDEFGEIEEDDS